MKVRVDPDLCTETCPDIFEMGEDVATVKVDVVPSDSEECVRQAAEDCPAEAIIIEG
jgi:ferredoxin